MLLVVALCSHPNVEKILLHWIETNPAKNLPLLAMDAISKKEQSVCAVDSLTIG